MEKLPHLAHFRRYLWKTPDLLIVRGVVAPVLEGKVAYEGRHRIPPQEGAEGIDLEGLLSAVSLAAISLAERESWGWSFTPPGTAAGVFIGIEPEGLISARVKPAAEERKAAVVQRMRPGEPLKESHFEVPEGGPARLVERFFAEVDQIPTRVAIAPGGPGVLVQRLPGGDLGEVDGLDDDQLVERVDALVAEGGLEDVGEVLVFYECRCHEGMIGEMIDGLPAERRAELWGELPQLEVECPRCGREFVLRRTNGSGEPSA